MPRWSDREIWDRHTHAEHNRGQMAALMDEALAYSMPWRRKSAKGRADFSRLFDSSAVIGTQRFANKIQRDFTPPFQRWVELKAGPMVPDDQVEQINRELETVSRIALAVIDASAFHKSSQEGYADLAVGTLALLAREGDDYCPIHWTATPAWALGIEEGPDGRIENVYFKKSYDAHVLERTWPKAQWPSSVRDKISKHPTDKVEVVQASYFDREVGWRIAVMCCDGGRNVVWESERRSNPWIIPRWFTMSGSPWGVGPLISSLPDVRTANKTVEMILSAAAFQLAPPLMVVNDGVVNPDQITMAPRALIKVARTGGPMGSSIEPMNLGANVNLAQIVLEDERTNIAKNLLNENLPPDTGPVRSAAEIYGRLKELQVDGGAAIGRLNHEYVPGVMAATLDILDKKKVASIQWGKLQLDQLVLKVNLISPMARGQNLDDVQNIVQWLETIKAIGGDELVVHSSVIEEIGPYLADKLGVTSKLVRSAAQRAQIEKAAGQAINQGLNGSAQPGKFSTAPAAPLALPQQAA